MGQRAVIELEQEIQVERLPCSPRIQEPKMARVSQSAQLEYVSPRRTEGQSTCREQSWIRPSQKPIAIAPDTSAAAWNRTGPQSASVLCMSSPHAMPSV